MLNASAIVKEHRKATRSWRKRLQDPQKAREFLIRAGILSKDGRRLAKQYR
jgi:hypothetical protein